MVDVQKYLLEHPGYIREGVTLSQFSFQIPRPLREDYVRKRPARTPSQVNPLPRAAAPDDADLQLCRPVPLPPPLFLKVPVSNPFERPLKQAKRTPSKHT